MSLTNGWGLRPAPESPRSRKPEEGPLRGRVILLVEVAERPQPALPDRLLLVDPALPQHVDGVERQRRGPFDILERGGGGEVVTVVLQGRAAALGPGALSCVESFGGSRSEPGGLVCRVGREVRV